MGVYMVYDYSCRRRIVFFFLQIRECSTRRSESETEIYVVRICLHSNRYGAGFYYPAYRNNSVDGGCERSTLWCKSSINRTTQVGERLWHVYLEFPSFCYLCHGCTSNGVHIARPEKAAFANF